MLIKGIRRWKLSLNAEKAIRYM